MTNYREYLPELKSTTLFQDIEDDALIAMLDAMQPKITVRKKGEMNIGPMEGPRNWEESTFRVILKSVPSQGLAPRRFKYDMPKFGEPGMMMGEIPALSRFPEVLEKEGKRGGKMPHAPRPLDYDLYTLECSGEMLTRFYSPEIAPAQGVMLRNFLGILAQKVMDVRQELFLLRDGRDIFNPVEEKED